MQRSLCSGAARALHQSYFSRGTSTTAMLTRSMCSSSSANFNKHSPVRYPSATTDKHGKPLGPGFTKVPLRDRYCTDPYEAPGERPLYPKRRNPFARAKALINSLHEEEGLRMVLDGRAVVPKKLPRLRAGEILTVTYAPSPKTPEFVVKFTGICISMRKRGLGSTFVLRNVIDGVPVERGFPLYSPLIKDAVVIGRRKVKTSKLYWLRNRPLKESTFDSKKWEQSTTRQEMAKEA